MKITISTLSFLFCLSSILFAQKGRQEIRFEPNQTVIVTATGPGDEYLTGIIGTHIIDNEGYMLLPHIGRVKVSGYTPAYIGRVIASRYVSESYFRKMVVQVSPSWARDDSQTITFAGEAQTKGDVPYESGMTLSVAIAKAGGLSPYAGSKVVIRRGSESKLYNIKDIERGSIPDPIIRPGDIITVKKRWF